MELYHHSPVGLRLHGLYQNTRILTSGTGVCVLTWQGFNFIVAWLVVDCGNVCMFLAECLELLAGLRWVVPKATDWANHLHLCILSGHEGHQNMLRVFGGMQMIQILRAKHSYRLCSVHADGTWWSGLTKKKNVIHFRRGWKWVGMPYWSAWLYQCRVVITRSLLYNKRWRGGPFYLKLT